MIKKPFRLLLAVPCMDYVNANFMKSLTALERNLIRNGIAFDESVIVGTLIYVARNSQACKAINEGFTHLLFLDSDMVFDENIVETLCFSGKEIVCGAFQSRREPYGSCVYTSLNPLERVKEYGAAPFQVEGCGMACTLINTEALKAVAEKYEKCFSPEKYDGIRFGEDLAFCWRARSLGYEIWCDPAARIGHIAHMTVWPGEEPAK